MRRSIPLVLAALVLAIVGLLSQPSATKTTSSVNQWAHKNSDIAVNDRMTFGHLPNGLRYVIVPNKEPQDQLSMRLHIGAGSLDEADNQQGVAHFLEHMVFNGSKNFTPDELIPKMQRLGIAFGAHANAYTSFDETVYMLDLPNTEDSVLNLAFTVMRDFADGALLQEKEIDKERGVILSEKTSRDSVGFRLMKQQFSELLPQSLITKRFPIGTEEIIKSAPRERFVDFYKNHYVPRNMTFIIVGDIDVKAMKNTIETTFTSMQNPATPHQKRELGELTSRKDLNSAVYADKEVPASEVSLIAISPFKEKPDTRANRLKKLPLSLAQSMLNQRFSKLAKKADSPITSGGTYDYDLFAFAHIAGIQVGSKEGQWEACVGVMEQEFRRAITHGFTKSELDEARAGLLNAYEQSVAQEETRKSASIAMEIVQSINSHSVLSSAKTDFDIIKDSLVKLTPEDCHKAFQNLWKGKDLTLTLTTQVESKDDKTRLTTLYKTSQKQAVEAPENVETGAWAYTTFGQPGLAKVSEIKDLGITQAVFPNGVRLNLKSTDFDKKSVLIQANFGSGKLTMPLDKPGLDTFLGFTFDAGGLGKHSIDDLQRILAGRNVSSSLVVGEDRFTLSGRTTPDDLTLQLQLMTAYLTDPGMRPEAITQFRSALPQIYNQIRHSEQGAFQKMQATLYGNDPRFTFPDQTALASYSAKEALAWISPAAKNSYLEISIVGDFDKKTALAAVASTFGALPQQRLAQYPALKKERQITPAKAPFDQTYKFDSKIPKGIAVVVWPTEGTQGNVKKARRLGLLADILSDRMRKKIREELGAAYSPRAGSSQSSTFPTIGFIRAVSPGKPEDIAKVNTVIRELANDISTGNITADEFERSLKPRQSGLKESLRQNGYWLGSVLSRSQSEPGRLDWARERDTDYASITVDELNVLAKQYLSKNNCIRVEILPTGAEK